MKQNPSQTAPLTKEQLKELAGIQWNMLYNRQVTSDQKKRLVSACEMDINTPCCARAQTEHM